MKIIILLILTVLTATSVAIAEECLPPSDISITKDANTGKFIVNFPNGSFQFVGEQGPISATGPISFISADIDSYTRPPMPDGPYNNIFAINILCWYGVDSSRPGTYPGGIFILEKIDSRNKSYDLSGPWFWDLRSEYSCMFDLNGCQFSVHS